jgi:integrase
MREADMDLEGGRLYIRARKNCHDRWLPISESLSRRLRLVIGIMRSIRAGEVTPSEENPSLGGIWSGSGVVDQQVQNVRRYFDRVQLEIWGEKLYCLYSLRHQVAHQCYRKMTDIRKVQRVMGHKYVTSTERYLRQVEIDEMEEEIKDAVK